MLCCNLGFHIISCKFDTDSLASIPLYQLEQFNIYHLLHMAQVQASATKVKLLSKNQNKQTKISFIMCVFLK